MKKQRKGQFYIFTSVVLVLLLIGIVPLATQKYVRERIFLDLNEDYSSELSNVMNNALYHGIDMNESIHNFSSYFRDYAVQRDRNYGFVTVVKDSDGMIVLNMMKRSINVTAGTVEYLIQIDESKRIGPAYEIGIWSADFNHVLEFDPARENSYGILFWSERNGNIYIREAYG